MAYGDEVPIREDLLAKLPALIEAHKGKLTVINYDVQMQTWAQGGAQPQLVNAWCLILVTLGALLGPQHYLSYVWTFHPTTPIPPNDRTLKDGVINAFRELGIMQVRQLQAQAPPNLGGTSAN